MIEEILGWLFESEPTDVAPSEGGIVIDSTDGLDGTYINPDLRGEISQSLDGGYGNEAILGNASEDGYNTNGNVSFDAHSCWETEPCKKSFAKKTTMDSVIHGV